MPVTPELARRRLAALIALLAGTVALVGVVPIAAASSSGSPASVASVASVVSTADAYSEPDGYYDAAAGKAGAQLHSALHDIIDGHNKLTYNALWDALAVTDRDPENPNNVILFYSRISRAASNHGGSSGQWNREHSWAKSHGGFGETTGPGTDLFHMRPADVQTNSSRSNKDFDNGGSANVPNCSGCRADSDSFEAPDVVKGDLARGLFYMAIRYDGYSGDQGYDLEMANSVNTSSSSCSSFSGQGTVGCHGKLSTLITWSANDLPDSSERQRNEVIYDQFQFNRNPFIDYPELVDYLWGDKVGQAWPGPDVQPTDEPTDPTTTDNPTDEPTDPSTTDNPTDSPTDEPTDPSTTDNPTDPSTTDNPTDEPTDPTTTDNPTDTPTDPTTTVPPCSVLVMEPAMSTTKLKVVNAKKLRAGKTATVRVRVTPAAAATGAKIKLTVRNGGATWFQTKKLTKGKAIIKVGPLAAGKLTLRATYKGKVTSINEECRTGATGWFGSRATSSLTVRRR